MIRWLHRVLCFIFSRLLSKRKFKSTKDISDISTEECPFSDGQVNILNKGIAYGLDMTDIMKPKYSPEQMEILMEAKMIGVDITEFNSYIMSPKEMQYNFYKATIDKYLSKGCVDKILQNGKYSLNDVVVKVEIKKALDSAFNLYTKKALKYLEDSGTMDREKTYLLLQSMCKDRDLNSSRLKDKSVKEMFSEYSILEKEAITQDTVVIKYSTVKQYMSINPTVQSILKRDSLAEMSEPIEVTFNDDKKRIEYYQINSSNSTYLCSPGKVTIELDK